MTQSRHSLTQPPASRKAGPKFAAGDAVVVAGRGPGVVTEVAEHDEHWLASHPQHYSVRLAPWEKAGGRYRNPADHAELRDHECDTLGGVPESDLKAG